MTTAEKTNESASGENVRTPEQSIAPKSTPPQPSQANSERQEPSVPPPTGDIPVKYLNSLPEFAQDADREKFGVEAARFALIGIGMSNLIGHKNIKWGHYLERELDQPHVNRLALRMQEFGVIHKEPIPILVKKDWLTKSSDLPKILTHDLRRFPTLQLSSAGNMALQNQEIHALGGNHRREARNCILTKASEELGTIENPKILSPNTNRDTLDMLRRARDDVQQFPTALYDAGER